MDIAALIVSILAIIIAAWALVYSRQQAQSNTKLATIEENRHAREVADLEALEAASKVADVRLTLLADAPGAPILLVIYNSGPAVAGNVTVELDATAGGAPRFISHAQRQSVPDISPARSEEVRLVTDYDEPVSVFFDAILRWTDPRGPQESRTRLSLWQ